MQFEIEYSLESERDFELIFEHLFDSYLGFGENVDKALEHATRRIFDIRRAAEQLSSFPVRGTLREDILPGIRFISIDKAVYWFDVDETARKVRVHAIFFGGQDHILHMLTRMLGKNIQN